MLHSVKLFTNRSSNSAGETVLSGRKSLRFPEIPNYCTVPSRTLHADYKEIPSSEHYILEASIEELTYIDENSSYNKSIAYIASVFSY